MTSILKRKRLTATLATLLVVLGAGAAYAYWTSAGSGSGTAGVGTDAGVSISNVAFDGTIYPGGTVGVTFKVNNTSSDTAVKVGQVIANAAAGAGGISGLPNGCSAADFTYTPGTALNAKIAAGASTTGAGTLQMADTSVNQDACKNATPVLNLIVNNAAI